MGRQLRGPMTECSHVEGKQKAMSDFRQEEAALTGRIEILEAICLALDRRREVFALLEAATDPNAALERLQEVLGLEPLGAKVVLDLQLQRLTASSRDRTSAELAEANARLRELRKTSKM